jgi:gas vesicle structural protein
MGVTGQSTNYLRREPHPSGLADVLNVILDKGLVIDLYLRVAVVGIELLTVDARVVIASVDTYLRFAEAVNRLDIVAVSPEKTLPEVMEDLQEGGARRVTRGAIDGVKDAVRGE